MAWKTTVTPPVEDKGTPEDASGRPFTGIAPYYDDLMWDINYEGWVSYVLQICRKLSLSPKTILDLACGTGTCCIIFARKGYQVLGVDGSEEMLEVARKKTTAEGAAVRFIKQDMRDLSVDQEVDLITCLFDSINYLLEKDELVRCLNSVRSALSNGGLFAFDMNTDYGLSTFWNGSTIVRDERGVFSVWKNSYNSKSRIAKLDLTLFAKEGDSHRRMDEVHLEKAYSLDEIRDCMKRAGLEEAGLYHHLTFSRPTRTSKRIMIVARKRGG